MNPQKWPSPVLLVDDDQAFRRVYGAVLRDAGCDVREAQDRDSAERVFRESSALLVLLDLMLPPDGTAEAGVAQLRRFLALRPSTKVIVVSGAGDTRAMLEAVRDGAYDFLKKPAEPELVLTLLERASQRIRLEAQIRALQESLVAERPADSMLGDSRRFASAVELARRVASSALPVLLLGENGTGKELMARFIHASSPRSAGPLVTVNCGAIPDTLYESTLFGHRRGAFTGALREHAGLFQEADGGTLFLDEIADMPLPQQVKLLRALELGEILPVGAERPVRVDVRIVSATHQSLHELQATGAFREDLYWRIRGAEVHLPPLRERQTDLPLLAAFFLGRAAALAGDGQPRALSEAAVECLLGHGWPGNLRELRHELQRATVLAGTRTVLEPSDFSFHDGTAPSAPSPELSSGSLQQRTEALERRELEAALAAHSGNRTRAAAALGISRQGLLNKLRRWGLG